MASQIVQLETPPTLVAWSFNFNLAETLLFYAPLTSGAWSYGEIEPVVYELHAPDVNGV